MGFDPAACTLGGHPKASSYVARDRRNVLEQVNGREARDHRDLARLDDATGPGRRPGRLRNGQRRRESRAMANQLWSGARQPESRSSTLRTWYRRTSANYA
jgi:hypothetical protein